MITKKAKEKQDVKCSCQEVCREQQDSIIRAAVRGWEKMAQSKEVGVE